MGLIRSLLTVALLAGLVYCGATVKLGNRTFFGHIQNVWQAEETQELVDGVKEASGPAVDKVKRGLRAGLDEVQRDEPLDAGIQATP